ncbi:tRNA threonylcarbamoyladenosine dehydratase, partial [Neisseria sp. P0005.S008]
FSRPFVVVLDAIDQIRGIAALAAFFVQHNQPFFISGGAGGHKKPALIQNADLSPVTHHPLLSKFSNTLRKRNGFSRQ